MNKTIAIWTAVILGGLFALFWFTAPTTKEAALNNAPSVDTSVGQSSLLQSDVEESTTTKLIIGDPSAPVTLVEYGDFKCPSCNSFHQNAGAQIRDEYVAQGLVNIEFRNYPFLGPDSGRAARGSYCAHEQGAFTEYHDKIYDYIWDTSYSSGTYADEFVDIFSVEKIVEVMGDSVASPVDLKTCIESTTLDDEVDNDISLARQDGITGTPGFVIDGQKINGPSSFATFKTLFDALIR